MRVWRVCRAGSGVGRDGGGCWSPGESQVGETAQASLDLTKKGTTNRIK